MAQLDDEHLTTRKAEGKKLTKEDFFHRLDKKLSREEREELAACPKEALGNCHFGLGLWIRNTWMYGGDGSLARAFTEVEDDILEDDTLVTLPMLMVGGADMLSSQVIEEYWEYLRMKKETKMDKNVSNADE